MCGIAGFIDTRRELSAEDLRFTMRAMISQLHHRGPDDGDVWADARVGVALGHRRLAILDLSAAGRQPMQSACGRYWISFNGEIYNFRSLRTELEEQGCLFRGHSDTEVMLAAIENWGIACALKRFNGMFAFALWDTATRTLTLARDRLGEKPLYYGWAGPAFVFASELKALRQHPCFDNRVNREALALYLRYYCVPGPFCIYDGIRKLSPGCTLRVSNFQPGELPRPDAYWSATTAAEAGVAHPFTGDEQEAAVELEALLTDAVRLRMESDVPLGAFLSGGVDSSTIVALMQSVSTQRVRTFTIGFHEPGYDEAVHARRVAEHLETEHEELYVGAGDMLRVIPQIPQLYDEPFSDSSQIPTYLVSKMARQFVTVVLSGDGGDELFGGYNRYSRGERGWSLRARIPAWLRIPTARFFRTISALPGTKSTGRKASRLATRLEADDADDFYLRSSSGWAYPESVVLGTQDSLNLLRRELLPCNLADFTLRMMWLDTISYLPDDILVKVDRASMGVGLESRIPLLDHRVVEFAWRLPLGLKRSARPAKSVLRRVLYRRVPTHLIERPKKGFSAPVRQWLAGPLRDWAEHLLDERRLRCEGFFDPKLVRQAWADQVAGATDLTECVWNILMFQAWLEETRHSSEDTNLTNAVAVQV